MHRAACIIQHSVRDRMRRRTHKILKAQELQLRCMVCWSFPPAAPLFPQCCSASVDSPCGCICFQCLYSYFELDDSSRGIVRRTWATCGCTVDNAFAHHTTDALFNRILDTIPGELNCFLCSASFDSQNALCRHLFDDCPLLRVACNHCEAFGPREHILGAHYQRHHKTVQCPICHAKVRSFEEHALAHVQSLLNSLSGHQPSEFFRFEVHRLVDELLCAF